MNSQTDQQLLCDYTGRRSEAAFSELVRRHVDFVYSAALRMVCDSHLAEDVTQGVFVAFAKNAAQLTNRPVLSGWLHRTTQNIAAQTVRTIERRRAREQEAAAMNELLANEPSAIWEHIAPCLDKALGVLNETDRDALLLRYFERKSARDMAQTLGVSEDAAQKRVSRAVERLREFFAKRGITAGASGLVVVITANAVQAAPVGLAITISTAAALTGATLATTATATATKAIATTTLQKTLIVIALTAAVGTGIYEARQASTLLAKNQLLQQEQAEQMQRLQRARDDANQQLAALREENERLNRNTSELPKLRGEVTSLKNNSRELARLKASEANDPTESAAKAWLKRVNLLKQRLEEAPEAKIPELQLLSEKNWLDVVKNFDLKDEKEYRQALSQLRTSGEAVATHILQAAMNKYTAANGGQYTGDLSLLKPYFDTPLEDSILQRYVVYPDDILQKIRLGGDWAILLKSPIDAELDSRLAMGPYESGSLSFNTSQIADTLAPAFKAYSTANNGKMPADPAQIEPYLATTEQRTALQQYVELRKQRGK